MVDRLPGSYRKSRITVHCERCGSHTQEGKPLCSRHSQGMDYVSTLCSRIAERERQDADVLKRGRASDDDLLGITAAEILGELRVHGQRSAPRIARQISSPIRVVEIYCRALSFAGVVRLGVTDRGVQSVELLEARS